MFGKVNESKSKRDNLGCLWLSWSLLLWFFWLGLLLLCGLSSFFLELFLDLLLLLLLSIGTCLSTCLSSILIRLFFRSRGGSGSLFAPTWGSHGNGSTDHLSEFREFLRKLGIVPLQGNILDVKIGEVILSGTSSATHEFSDLHLLSVNEHTIKLINGGMGSFSSFIMNVSVSLGRSRLSVGDNLAGKNISKQRKGIVELLVVNALIEILDKDISNSRATEGGIPLTPHDTTGLSLNIGEIHRVECTLGIRELVKINIRVPEGTTSDCIATDTDGGDGSHRVENFKEKSFVDLVCNVSHVKGGRVEPTICTGGLVVTAAAAVVVVVGSGSRVGCRSLGGSSRTSWGHLRGGFGRHD
mmetsp:Transcript_8527/g.12160  ORF Transcript_8527/g.12160 Transcript_8527/m.12160 type:complete len:356 (-) Transcript_8527:151-1218(-)